MMDRTSQLGCDRSGISQLNLLLQYDTMYKPA